MLIASCCALEVLDSRGRPTVEVEIVTSSGHTGRAIVPSGASTGAAEALELRDGSSKRYGGLGVQRAVHNVNRLIAPRIRGMSVTRQADLDRKLIALDGTPNKRRLGANAILGVSMAAAHAAAASQKLPLFQSIARQYHVQKATLPLPMINMISGGLHAGRNLDFQDFLIMPVGARSIKQSLEWTSEVYRTLGALLKRHGHIAHLVADEGGYGPSLRSNEEALRYVADAIRAAGFRPRRDIGIAVDVASTHFFSKGQYRLASEKRSMNAARFADFLARLCDRHPILSLEDPMSEEDWVGWEIITKKLRSHVQLIGDDLFATNTQRLVKGIERGIANAVLIKVNQIGTLSETWETLITAQSHGYRTIISARSGESEDSTMSDLAVGWNGGQIKIGSITRSERLAKYNQLLRIENRLGKKSKMAQPFQIGYA